MRAIEFIVETQVLDEIDMSPSSLKQLAAGTGAIAGMEFEMYVPDVTGGDDDEDSLEPDYDEDQPARSLDQIVDFFEANGDWNSPTEVSRLQSKLQEEYGEWVLEKISEDWDHSPTEHVYQWAKDNINFEDRDELEEIVERAVEEGYGNDIYDQANEAFRESMFEEYMYDDSNERAFLQDSGIRFMSDVESGYDITWPYWKSPEPEGIKKVAIKFMNDLGMNSIAMGERYGGPYDLWNGSEWTYLGKEKPTFCYTIEPDGSLTAKKNATDAGLEFVSNPLPVDEMINSLNEVVQWARKNGCYTFQPKKDSSSGGTGLHMSVSVPGFSREKLDYVKLALLLGDEYVLKEFGREANSYTKSAMSNLQGRATYMQSEPELLSFFDEMRKGLSVEAAKLIHNGNTSKFTSINTKDKYIEFRSPGGDWLKEDIPKLENTLLRFVVALDAACDPQKYRNEYLKKLEALLSSSGKTVQYYDPQDKDNDKQPVKFSDERKKGWVQVVKPKGEPDVISYFTKYSTGQLLKGELKQFLQRARGIEKPIEPIKAKVSAGPAEPAFGQPPGRNNNYQIYDRNTGEEIETIQAADDEEALQRLDNYRRMARNSASSIDPNRFVLRHMVNS